MAEIRPGSVLAGWVHDGYVRTEFMTSIMRLMTSEVYPLLGELTECYCGALVSDGRNSFATRLLDSGMDWLWMADTDIVFEPGCLARLLDAADPVKRPVMTGLVPVPIGDGGPAIYTSRCGEDGKTCFDFRRGWASEEVIQIDGCGAACLLIHRGALEAIAEEDPGNWFHQIPGYGEDLSFSLRCAAAGVPIWAHTGASCGHVKSIMLGKALP